MSNHFYNIMNKESESDNSSDEEPKKKNQEINEMTVREILDMEFDSLEEWVETELDKIKNKCIDDFNGFNITFPLNTYKFVEKQQKTSYNPK